VLRATWYCEPGVSRCTSGYPADCLCAAISPDLAYLRGKLLDVCSSGRCIRVRVVDCNCAAHKAIDLYAAAFRRLAPLETGVLWVLVALP
jgi:hypothetical protein